MKNTNEKTSNFKFKKWAKQKTFYYIEVFQDKQPF